MQINPTSQNISNTPFGSKVQYLYHFTPKQNYESMLKSGFIKTTHDRFIKQGVFMFDLKNVLQHWGNFFVGKFKSEPLDEKLLNQITKNHPNEDIVLLRIPVKKLNKKKLAIRSQNKLFETGTPDGKGFKEGVNVTDELLGHLQGKTLIKDGKRYKSDAVEYIFLDRIPMKDVKKIGEINPSEYSKRTKGYTHRPVVDYIIELTKNIKKERAMVEKEVSKI